MKRLICTLMVVVFLLAFCSCSATQESQQSNTLNFYYCNSNAMQDLDTYVIAAENRDPKEFSDALDVLLNEYFKGPVSSKLYSPFPSNLKIESIVQSNTHIQITLSSAFSNLSDIDFSLACACLTMTVHELTGFESIYISYENASTGKRHTISLTPDAYLLDDNSVVSDINEGD